MAVMAARPVVLASLLFAFLSFALRPTTANSNANDLVQAVELPLPPAQGNANLNKEVVSLQQQVHALQAVLASVVSNAAYAKRQEPGGDLPPGSNCTDLHCVRMAVNKLDDLIMQLYATRLSYAVQAAFLKYAGGQDVLDPSREVAVIARAEANAVVNNLPPYVGSVMYGNHCMLYVSKRMEVEALNAAYNASLPLPVQHADNFTNA